MVKAHVVTIALIVALCLNVKAAHDRGNTLKMRDWFKETKVQHDIPVGNRADCYALIPPEYRSYARVVVDRPTIIMFAGCNLIIGGCSRFPNLASWCLSCFVKLSPMVVQLQEVDKDALSMVVAAFAKLGEVIKTRELLALESLMEFNNFPMVQFSSHTPKEILFRLQVRQILDQEQQ